jgi:hypothetical protein
MDTLLLSFMDHDAGTKMEEIFFQGFEKTWLELFCFVESNDCHRERYGPTARLAV